MSKRASKTAMGSSAKNAKAVLKVEHLKALALWAGREEASIPSSLGAFFGQKLASFQEGIDLPPDPSLLSCQRCEKILQPGFNCTVRIEKNRAKARRRSKKPANFTFTQNNVVYTCEFCSERNVKRGTSRGHTKAICPAKTKKTPNLRPAGSNPRKSVTPKKSTAGEDKARKLHMGTPIVDEEIPSVDKIIIPSKTDEEIRTVDGPTTPMVKPVVSLLDSKRKKRNKSASKKRPGPEDSPAPEEAENSASTTNKRRRKSWTSLKELADRNQQKKNISDLSIPFLM